MAIVKVSITMRRDVYEMYFLALPSTISTPMLSHKQAGLSIHRS